MHELGIPQNILGSSTSQALRALFALEPPHEKLHHKKYRFDLI